MSNGEGSVLYPFLSASFHTYVRTNFLRLSCTNHCAPCGTSCTLDSNSQSSLAYKDSNDYVLLRTLSNKHFYSLNLCVLGNHFNENLAIYSYQFLFSLAAASMYTLFSESTRLKIRGSPKLCTWKMKTKNKNRKPQVLKKR